MRRIALVVVCGAVLAGFIYGGARVEVAKDRLRDKIDALLGGMDVKRKEIEIGLKGLKEGIDGLRKAKIRAEVSTELIARQTQPQEERLADMDVALKTLRGHLAAARAVEIAGRSYSPQELKDMADRVLSARKVCSGQLEAFHQAQGRLKHVASTLERKQQEAQGRLTEIEGQVAIIDSSLIAVNSMRQSAEAMGDDGSLAQGLDHLAAKVNDLFVDVETELRVQDERWATAATKEINSVDALVARLHPSDTIGDIDRILGVTKR